MQKSVRKIQRKRALLLKHNLDNCASELKMRHVRKERILSNLYFFFLSPFFPFAADPGAFQKYEHVFCLKKKKKEYIMFVMAVMTEWELSSWANGKLIPW